MLRVLLAENDPSVCRALTRVLRLERDVEIVGHAADGEMALALTRELRPDALLLNVRLPVQGGIEVIRVLHAEFPALCILGLVGWYEDAQLTAEMAAAGAFAVFTAVQPIDALIKALRACFRQDK